MSTTPDQDNLSQLRSCVTDLQRAYDTMHAQLAARIRTGQAPGVSVFELVDTTGRHILAPVLVELVRARTALVMADELAMIDDDETTRR